MKILLWLGLSVASGIAYHVAGRGGFKGAKLLRRLLCPLLFLGLLWGLRGLNLRHWWIYLLTLGLSIPALGSYWSELIKPKDDVSTMEWLATGLFYGLAALPLIWCGISWTLIVIRAVLLAFAITFIRIRSGKVRTEEFWSGFVYLASMPLLFL